MDDWETNRDQNRSRIVRLHWQKAVRRLRAVNRLAGLGAPGTGGLFEEAKKRGEQRNTNAVLHARALLDADPELLVQHAAALDEAQHEAEAALKNLNVIRTNEITKLLVERARCRRELKDARAALREERSSARAAVRKSSAAISRAEEARARDRVRGDVHHQILTEELRSGEARWQRDVACLRNRADELEGLTSLIVNAPCSARAVLDHVCDPLKR